MVPFTTMVAPSRHLSEAIAGMWNGRLETIPNAVDPAFWAAASISDVERGDAVLVVAADLRDPAKADPGLLTRLVDAGVRVISVGRHASPVDGVEHLGPIHDRGDLARLYASVRATLFTSQTDNYPLVPIESMLCGTPVAALSSPATEEQFEAVGRQPCVDVDTLLAMVVSRSLQGPDPGLRSRAEQVWAPDAMIGRYHRLYGELA